MFGIDKQASRSVIVHFLTLEEGSALHSSDLVERLLDVEVREQREPFLYLLPLHFVLVEDFKCRHATIDD